MAQNRGQDGICARNADESFWFFDTVGTRSRSGTEHGEGDDSGRERFEVVGMIIVECVNRQARHDVALVVMVSTNWLLCVYAFEPRVLNFAA